ncbi:hypothetical protein MBLNU230_g7558t1 [Neophaeotheca triangularis]
MTAPSARKQTIKQAKASFKSRNNCPISDKEKRQLERGLELDRRARWAREKEKRKTDAQKEKAERDKAQKHAVVLSTQRVGDRFGFKSSQRHLGAFFGGGAKSGPAQNQPVLNETSNYEATGEQEEAEDGFGGDELDDDSLLEAFETPKDIEPPKASQFARDLFLMPPPPLKRANVPMADATPAYSEDDLSWLEDDMESSTQIARDLDSLSRSAVEDAKEDARTASFGSSDFDLTPEEIDMLDPPKQSKDDQARILMPPPPTPAPTARKQKSSRNSEKELRPQTDKQSAVSPAQPTSSDPGFTLSQLESFVEDDLQLTQAAPG